MDQRSYVYILANEQNGTLYIGVTSDLIKRIWQHKNKVVPGFTCQYNVDKLVFFEEHGSIVETIQREKGLKKWLRKWKLRLIEENNPNWIDLYETLCS